MNLFISYGHDGNVPFVLRVMTDLERHGHACWIDSERIHEHQDWRRSLMEALHGCDWTVGFLSAHAMRPGGITRQELAIANDVKAGCLTTVLLEPLDGTWELPISVGHAQWIDMSEHAVRATTDSAGFEAWYAAKLDEGSVKNLGQVAALVRHQPG